MSWNSLGRTAVVAAPVLLAGVLTAGCMGSPTYGTSRTANAQLTSDLSSMFSMKTQRGSAPDYRPRPELVKPATTTELPPPQENITASSPNWPESPEQKRARILAGREPGPSPGRVGQTADRRPTARLRVGG